MSHRYGSVMIQQRIVAIALFAIIFLAPFSLLLDENNQHLDDSNQSHADAATPAPDVPNYRIGDEWTYDTLFDVAALIAQANVTASINTLTGETDYEITDIKFMMIDGV